MFSYRTYYLKYFLMTPPRMRVRRIRAELLLNQNPRGLRVARKPLRAAERAWSWPRPDPQRRARARPRPCPAACRPRRRHHHPARPVVRRPSHRPGHYRRPLSPATDPDWPVPSPGAPRQLSASPGGSLTWTPVPAEVPEPSEVPTSRRALLLHATNLYAITKVHGERALII
jgi:hypothetical protein